MKMTVKRMISFALVIALCLIMLPSVAIPTKAASTGLGEVKITGGQRDFLWPVPGVYKLTSCFLDPDFAATRGRYHYAIDIGAASGKSVVASYDGTVDDVGQNSSEGNWVRLKHSYKLASGNTITLYTKYIHLKSYSVEKDQTVKKGEKIAEVGNTGDSGGAHLDFQILTSTAKKSASNSLDPYANNLLELPDGIHYKGTCDCCKSYISTIKELYTSPLSYLSQCTAYPTHVTIKTTKSTYVKSLPCSEKTDANSENVEVASAGSQYKAIGLYVNTAGNLWYKVGAKNGSVGYMYAGDTTFVSVDTSDIVHSGITVPTNHTQGKSYSLTGTISSTYSKINKITVYVYDAQGNKITGTEDAVTGNKYSLKGSTIDSKTKFGSLAVGTHKYKVTVYFEYCYADSATIMTTWSTVLPLYEKTFNVVSSTSCSHSYTYKVAKAPTTSATGSLTGTCSKCSGTTTVTLPKLTTTDYTYKVTKAATCTATGTGRYTWKTTTYGSFYFDVTIAKADHSWNSATCTKPKTCSVCAATSGAVLGHSYTYKAAKAPTTSATGSLTGTCSKCSGTTTVTLPKLTTTDYTYKVTKAATCTATGTGRYTWKTTTYGSFYFDVTIAKADHSWNSATCTKPKTCSVCAATSGTALGHSYNSGVITTAATCTTAGVKTYTCNTCAAKKTESITATGHSWNSATCTAAKTCSTCGATSGTELEHSYKAEITPPTCTEQGYTTHTCSVCGDSYKDSTTSALGHQYSDGSCVRCGAEDPNYVANQNMPKIIVEGANAKAGETVSVTIALKNNPGITALNLAFRYDTTALTFVSAENMATDMTMTWGTAYVWDCASNYTHSGDLLKITFQIADNATSGDYSVEVIFLDASNEDFKEVQMSVESGYITVTAAIYGDANGDGKVTTVDLSMLRKYLANIDPSTGESSLGVKLGADVNGDGKVSTVDLSMLRKYFANMDPVTGESALVLGPR